MLTDAPHSIVVRNIVDRVGNGIVLDSTSGRSIIAGNQFSFNLQSGLVAFSGSNIILLNRANNNTVNGFSVAGSSNILFLNKANYNGQRGIGLDNVCPASGASFPSGNGNILIRNVAKNNSIDFFWDGQGIGNLWLFDVNNLQRVPTTPPTAPIQC